ncbi:hypothetical protein PUV47_16525 [Pseudovibrio exalbescens]|uniref:hypothetical protein n=1 Tax=Pseudovibrio exalbescens TaxID=197461 RepID=UPI0023669CF4|nr:hypothetical protein [Pseudovibrio exalbescens]MDD7911537.1 hypothetical protein [Pseudovibrio exalbescens]
MEEHARRTQSDWIMFGIAMGVGIILAAATAFAFTRNHIHTNYFDTTIRIIQADTSGNRCPQAQGTLVPGQNGGAFCAIKMNGYDGE